VIPITTRPIQYKDINDEVSTDPLSTDGREDNIIVNIQTTTTNKVRSKLISYQRDINNKL
jgi:hypothetical protein